MTMPCARDRKRRIASLAATAILCGTSIAAADSVTLRGSTIPLRNLEIQSIRAGEVFYLDRNGRPTRRLLDEISQLGFDELPKLDRAETAWDEGKHDAALRLLLQALLEVEEPAQRLWLHVRLSRVHDARDEYVPAAGHAAAAMMLEPSAYWRVLEPTCQPIEPTFAQAVEADDLLREAARQVADGTLQQTIERMRQIVRPIRQQLESAYNGPPIAQGSTWSGFSRRRIAEEAFLDIGEQPTTPAQPGQPMDRADETPVTAPELKPQPKPESNPASEPETDAPPTSTPALRDDPPPAVPAPRVVDSSESDRVADEIDALLQAGEYAEALNRCEAAGQRAAERDVARLLHQWGRALLGVEQPRDASVMFTRCAVLFPGTEHGVASLIETAMLYESVYKRPETSRRLLKRAIEQATVQGRDALAEHARGRLRELDRPQ